MGPSEIPGQAQDDTALLDLRYARLVTEMEGLEVGVTNLTQGYRQLQHEQDTLAQELRYLEREQDDVTRRLQALRANLQALRVRVTLPSTTKKPC